MPHKGGSDFPKDPCSSTVNICGGRISFLLVALPRSPLRHHQILISCSSSNLGTTLDGHNQSIQIQCHRERSGYCSVLSNTSSVLLFHRLSLIQGSPARIISHAGHASVSELLELFLAPFKGQKQQLPDLASTLTPRAFHTPASRAKTHTKGPSGTVRTRWWAVGAARRNYQRQG